MGIEGMRQARKVFQRAIRKLAAASWWLGSVLLIPMVGAAVVPNLGPDLLLVGGATSAMLGLLWLGCVVAEVRASNALLMRQLEEARALRLAVIAGAAQVDLLLDNVAIIARQARKDAADAAARVLVLGRSSRGSLQAEADEIRRRDARSAAEADSKPAHVEGEPQEAGPDDLTVVRVVPEVPSSRRVPSVLREVPDPSSHHADSPEGDTQIWTRTMVSAGGNHVPG